MPTIDRNSLVWRFRDVHAFQSLNAMSYQIALGSPLILFARETGASAAIIGLIMGMTPLLAMLQVLTARRMQRVGYRQTMLAGWTGRVLTLLALVPLPFLSNSIPGGWIVVALVAIMFVFNLLRGLATGAWLPWLTALVPRSVRGAYLSNDRTFINIASVLSLGASGLILSGAHASGDRGALAGFTLIFAVSFVTGAVSLFYMRRIPNPPIAAADGSLPPALPWRAVWGDRVFRSFTLFTVLWQAVIASANAFIVVFAREDIRLDDGTLVLLSAGASFTAMIALRLVRDSVDRNGSKPFMRGVLAWWAAYFGLWLLMAARVIAFGAWLAPVILLANGFFAAIFETSTTRLLMNTAGDRPGSAQYFAVQQVQINLAAGLAPVVWGGALDTLSALGYGGARYGVFFGAQVALVGLMALMLRRVREARV